MVGWCLAWCIAFCGFVCILFEISLASVYCVWLIWLVADAIAVVIGYLGLGLLLIVIG